MSMQTMLDNHSTGESPGAAQQFRHSSWNKKYPTVNTLLNLWRLLTAKKVLVVDATRQVRALLKTVTADSLLDPKLWPDFTFFALVQPEGDILPVRAVYGDSRINPETNIGINPLTSRKPVWFAGPDIVASLLLTGKPPKILRAIRFKPVGVQKGMKPVALGKGRIDPYQDDFFCKVIEERKGKSKSDPLYYFLKILANAGCYGIYAEVNRHQTGKNDSKQIGIFSGNENRTERTCIFERPGPWYFPPASLITAGGRLLLALLERLVADAGGTYLMCDTDSMAIVASEHGGLVSCRGGPNRTSDGLDAIKALSWAEVGRIVDRFETLNPYDRKIVPGSVLNIVEEINFDSTGKQRQVYGYGISAKRYALFTWEGEKVRIIKASEHGLGLYYRPKEGRDPECDVPVWIKEGWRWILCQALGFRCKKPDWFHLPVMRRIAISTPNVMAALRKLDRDQARPYNFALSPVLVNLSGLPITLLGRFEKDSSKWSRMSYVNIHDGSAHTLDPLTLPVLVQTFEMVFAQYVRHLEAKSLAPDGNPCRADSHDLLKRHPVKATNFCLIGKESERGWEQAEDVSTLLPTLIHYQDSSGAAVRSLQEILHRTSLSTLQKRTGLSRHTILRARRGQEVALRSAKLILKAIKDIGCTFGENQGRLTLV